MTVSNTFLFLACVSLFWGIVTSLRIMSWLQKRGVKINFIFIRLYILKYVSQYREMSRAENGYVGPLFYSYIIAMNTALVCAIVGLVLR